MRASASLLRNFCFAGVMFLGITSSHAQQTGACEQFAWSLSQERAWFSAPDIPLVPLGTMLAALPDKAVVLNLAPADSVTFTVPPEGRARATNGYGGVITLPPMRPGLYQVTLSEDGWIDVIQDGRALTAEAHTGRRDCSGLRKSVRFQLKDLP